VGSQIVYESIADTVTEGPQHLPERVFELLRTHRPSIIVFDSFKAIGDLMPDLVTWRKVLYELAGSLSAYDTTTFWIGEYVADMVPRLPEFAVADGIVELTREQHGKREARYFRVAKLRGSGFLGGSHAFDISASGLSLYPRLISPPRADSYATTEERLQTGIQGLDDMIRTGWLRSTSTLVMGPPGSGKTLLGLHFLREGVRLGETALLVSFQENPSQLRRIVHNLGWETDTLLARGALEHFYTSPVELEIDSIIGRLFRRVAASGARRVVIDSIDDLMGAAPDAQRYRDYIYALTQRFSELGITAMLTAEASRSHGESDMSPLADNILLLEMLLGETLERTIRIVKSRGSAHDGRRFHLRIEPEGMFVGDPR
ncbi:MAG TPA: ATPase domain-containing protein, partial [Burkholderiaceae bacterium]